MDRIPENTWERVLGAIEGRLSPHSFNTWFRPTRFVGEDGSSVSVRVPNSWFADWLRTQYSTLIDDALRNHASPGVTIDFVPEETDEVQMAKTTTAPNGPASAAPNPSIWNGERSGRLNPRYTFDSFVVSSCNQFAHAAARAVSEQPTRAYNPLYVYGGVGLGKTHLMQAIGNFGKTGGRLHYTSSEQFMNELINAIRFEKTLEFKERYRNVDLLLIDDIQFLAGKERTQEEFFHTFNTLYDAQKQIVLTSDLPPRDIPLLEDRLRSRFEWGLIADIQPPDLETKIAILRKKAEAEGKVLPDDVALFVASNCESNIRELEGALIRVIAYSSISNQPIDLEMTRETLKNFVSAPSPSATVESIQKQVSNYFNLKVSQIKSKSNSQQIAFPRQIAMYLCKHLTHCSLQEIGQRFGGKHHSTVIHAVRKIDKKRGQEEDFDRLLESFTRSLK